MTRTPLAYVGPDMAHAAAIALAARAAGVVVADAMGARDALPVPVLAVPELRGHDTAALLRARAVATWLRAHGIGTVVFFKPTHRALQACATLGLHAAVATPALAQRLEHKIHGHRAAARAGLPVLPAIGHAGGLPPWEDVAALGPPVVVQIARSHAGLGTWRADDRAAYEALRPVVGRRAVRVSRFVAGPTWTLNGCVLPDRIVLGTPYRQLTGLPALTPRALASCGNLWASGHPAPPTVLAVGQRAGAHLAAAGHRGAFGVDVVVDADGRAWLVEINARITAGLGFESWLQHRCGLPALVRLHVATTTPTEPMPRTAASPLPAPWTATQLVWHATSPGVVADAPPAGTWRLAHAGLRRVSASLDPTRCGPDEAVVYWRSPGTPVRAGSEIARLQTLEALADPDADALTAKGDRWARLVRALCTIPSTASPPTAPA